MKSRINEIKFSTAWAVYEKSRELRKNAEIENSAEQQAYIQPLFSEAFPELNKQGITYKDSWTVDEETNSKITEWEISAQINEFCEKIASKNSKRINELLQIERAAETKAINLMLDILEQDSKNALTPEQMKNFREKVNAEEGTHERQKIIECIKEFIDNTQ